mmetsp:Transcript_5870/g.10458  ORF Transcript_5870/g.10458 Transcript_5870/m.10458 type:complete len:507 (-) Transcript_5870:33-1553(-)|eukprot:CAMPEP_0197621350 /NCGR_PEP_ID=MMETSP1338-20131121/1953_1 /TAXON_ID=43686 ORGANISM="Pelagodinium beii, Strain RCC1491" /NCGR_SAMPLE_ID=MMETSP1338 /ASSEMBLY_ACC=CAM_ASM_000754 /LENGTH=506 /DNA_ID=CAMNT_0043190797 /DNA_START=29 /DNA_END=1549 /DNA_ORIENTATION=+
MLAENCTTLDVPVQLDRDALDDDVCSGAGEEGMMQDFVRLHMMSMLQPFADRVRELQASVELLSEEQEKTSARVQEESEKLLHQDGQLSALQSTSEKTAELLEKLQAEASAAKRERNRLDGNHEMTKASVAKLKESCSEIDKAMEALQQSLETSQGRCEGLGQETSDLEKRLIERFDTRLDKQGRVCKELNEKQAELQKTCQQAKSLSERANNAVCKLSSLQESTQATDATSFESLESRTAELRGELDQLRQDVEKQAKGYMSVDREVQHLKTWTESLTDVQQLQALQTKTEAAVRAQAERLESTAAEVLELRSRPDSKAELYRAELLSLEKRLTHSLSEATKWRDGQKAHNDLLSSAGQRLQDLESEQSRLQAESGLAKQELQSLATWQTGAADELLSQRNMLDDARSGVSEAQVCLDELRCSVEGLQGEHGTTRETLSKLSSRLDLCHKYFSGLGKGLQDAQKQIAGSEGGLLPPKMGAEALPALLPRAPKTPRKSLPSPRRGL